MVTVGRNGSIEEIYENSVLLIVSFCSLMGYETSIALLTASSRVIAKTFTD